MRTSLLTFCLGLLLVIPVLADPPGTISYQGRLTDASGAPVANGSYPGSIALFNVPTGGSPLWTELHDFNTTDGLFTVVLGNAVPIPDTALTDTALYLEITVDTDPPISPRTRLHSVPYSRTTGIVDGAGPVLLSATDVASGAESRILHGIGPEAAGEESDCFKDISVTLLDTEVSHQELASLDSGYVETTTTESASGKATGKRQHRPLTIVKSTSVSNTLNAVTHDRSLHVDTGVTETMAMNKAELISKVAKRADVDEASSELEYTTLTNEIVVSASADNNRATVRAHDFHTNGDTARYDRYLSSDSGVTETMAMNKADLINEISKGVSETREHVLLARQVGVPGAAEESSVELETDSDGPSLLLSKTTSSDSAGMHMGVDDLSTGLELHAEYVPYLGDVILEIPAEVDSGPRLLLQSTDGNDSSLVAIAAGHASHGVLVQGRAGVSTPRVTVVNVPSPPPTKAGTSDTTAIEMVAADTAEWLALTTTTATTKWENITLKRGTLGSEVKVSHVGAGSNDGVFVSSNAAAGGAIGINTSSPTLPFHLVGSGCYTGTFGACSDRRLKHDISGLESPLETIRRLRGVRYYWNRSDYPQHRFPAGEQIGLIAQEVEAVLPSVVSTDAEGYKSVDYARLVTVAIEAIKTQQATLDRQEAELSDLKQTVAQLEDLVQQLATGGIGDGTPTYGSK